MANDEKWYRDRGEQPPASPWARFDALPLDDATWEAFYDTNGVAGYIPHRQQVVFANSDGDCFLFDLPTRSWVFGDARLPTSTQYSNMVVDTQNNLIVAKADGIIQQWDDSPETTSTQVITFPALHFQAPQRAKIIYAIGLIYQLSTTAPGELSARIVGGAQDTAGAFTVLSSTHLDDTAGQWDSVWIDVGQQECDTFQLRLSVTGDFRLDEVAIEYRVLPVKRV